MPSPATAPASTVRDVKVATPTDVTDPNKGWNCSLHEKARVDVVPGASAVDVEIKFWNEAAGKFISPVTAITHTNKANPFSFELDVNGQIILVAVIKNGGGNPGVGCKVGVSVFGPRE